MAVAGIVTSKKIVFNTSFSSRILFNEVSVKKMKMKTINPKSTRIMVLIKNKVRKTGFSVCTLEALTSCFSRLVKEAVIDLFDKLSISHVKALSVKNGAPQKLQMAVLLSLATLIFLLHRGQISCTGISDYLPSSLIT